MNLRPLTQDEQALLVQRLAVTSIADILRSLVAAALGAALVGSGATFSARIALGAAPLAWMRGIAAAAPIFVLLTTSILRANRSVRAFAKSLAADLARGEVWAETVQVGRIQRLREEEHFTELLLVHCADGRVRAVLDDSPLTTSGRTPRPSTRVPCRQMTVLRLPNSWKEFTHFTGPPLPRPKPSPSDPATWPKCDTWLGPADLARLTARIRPAP